MRLYDSLQLKMKLKMKNRSQRYYLNRPRPRHGHIYTKYKMCLNIMIGICTKQHLSNIWSSINEKIKQHWVEKGVAYEKACSRNCHLAIAHFA